MDSIAPGAKKAWPWPDSLDALVAAPRHHTCLFENSRVRVVHTHIPAGDLVPVHTHRWPGIVYVQSGSDFIRRDQHGNVLLDSRTVMPTKNSGVQWLEPLPPHSVENIGNREISLIIVELKDASV